MTQSTQLVWLKFPQVLRVHQWVKNLLLFVPLMTAHQFSDPMAWKKSLLAFWSFCFVASAVYLINDLIDLESDRLHPKKRNRPFASGSLPASAGYILIPTLLAIGGGLSFFVGSVFSYLLSLYFMTSFLYSLYLKKLLFWDVICLASLYTLRLFAGSSATEVPISKWLLAFSMFIFLSLAIAKRVSELKLLQTQNKEHVPGRGYRAIDEEALSNLGAASGYISVLVFALYLNSPEVSVYYRNPELLWGTCPLILYWISRIWIISNRGELHDDPIVFAIKDVSSYGVLLLVIFLLWLAT